MENACLRVGTTPSTRAPRRKLLPRAKSARAPAAAANHASDAGAEETYPSPVPPRAPPSNSRQGPNRKSPPVSERNAPTSTYQSRTRTAPSPRFEARDPVAAPPSSIEVSGPSDASSTPPAIQVGAPTSPVAAPKRPASHNENPGVG